MKKQRIGGPVKILRLLLLMSALCGLANAQVTAAISGKVEDATGMGVDGAAITVTSVETGAVRTTTTDQTGSYSVLSLPLGAQEVKAEKKGFKGALRTGIRLQVGADAVYVSRSARDRRSRAQQVTVSAEDPIVNTTTSQTSGVNRQSVRSKTCR